MSDLVWRPPTLEDIPAITSLAQQCDDAYGTLEVGFITQLERRFEQDPPSIEDLSRIVLSDEQVVGVCWIRGVGAGGESRQLFYAFASPEMHTLYRELVGWMLTKRPLDRAWFDQILRFERVLLPTQQAIPGDHAKLYESLGFELVYLEHEMLREVAPLDHPPKLEIDMANWAPDIHSRLRETYNAAFAERSFDGYSEDEWPSAFFIELGDIDPALSFVVNGADGFVGFVFGGVLNDPDDWYDPGIRGIGWIDSIGVVPTHTGHGIATALIARALDAFRDAGIERVGLRVNEDNTRARRLYEHLGFKPARKHVVYRRGASREVRTTNQRPLTTN